MQEIPSMFWDVLYQFLGRKEKTTLKLLRALQLNLYNDQRKPQVFYLFINLLLPYMFRVFFHPIFRGWFTTSVWFNSPGYGVSVRVILARALTPYPGDLSHYRNCTPVSEDGLKESPKHVRQK
jgi:hypothetical protein